MRIFPPLTTGFPKRVPPEGDTICGQFVPGGTDIYVNVHAMMRDRSLFGEDAHLFRPERFLECDEVKRTHLYKVIDLNFGHGRWLCAGKTLAWMELNKIFVEVRQCPQTLCSGFDIANPLTCQLLRKFDFQIVDPQRPWTAKAYTQWLIDDLLVRVMDLGGTAL